MKRMLNVDAFLLDIDQYDEKTINDFLSTYFAIFSQKIGAPFKFNYKKTGKGYTYKIERNCNYQLVGNHVIDSDCAIITGFKTIDFSINPFDPNHKPKAFCIQWYDGCYTPNEELEKLYKMLVGDGKEYAIPKKVRIFAGSTYMEVTVEYDPNDTQATNTNTPKN